MNEVKQIGKYYTIATDGELHNLYATEKEAEEAIAEKDLAHKLEARGINLKYIMSKTIYIYVFDWKTKEAVKRKVVFSNKEYHFCEGDNEITSYLDSVLIKNSYLDKKSCLQGELDARIRHFHRSMNDIFDFSKAHDLKTNLNISMEQLT